MIADIPLDTCPSCRGSGVYNTGPHSGTACGACEGTGKEMPQELRLGVHLHRMGEGVTPLNGGNVGYAGQLLITQWRQLKALRERVADLEALNTELMF